MRKVRQDLRVTNALAGSSGASIPDTCVLDMDGTLLDLYFDSQVWNECLPRHYGQRSGLSESAAREHVEQVLTRQRGTLTWYCFEHWSRVFRLELTQIEYELRHLITVRPGVTEFLEALQARGIRAVLATNAHPKSLLRKLEITGIGRYFDAIVSSHEFGYAKEHQKFWSGFAERYRIGLERTLFIDDNLAVLLAAQRFGIRDLYGIALPNSRGERLNHEGFECLENFSDLTHRLMTS